MTADHQPGALPGYVLEAALGEGATGTVHRARRSDWAGRVVAVKRIPQAAGPAAGRLRHEAEVLASLDHPHIVRVLDLVPDGDGLAIAMQYAPGGSLDALLHRRGRLAPGEVVAVAAPLADALASAHRRGVLHCDVKPANVLFTSDGEPLLSDFGLARVGRCAPGLVVGTAEYLDPAVAGGAAPTPASDIYGLGAVCYELLAGRPPFSPAGGVADVLADAATRRPAPLRELAPGAPPALVAAVERAMARRPDDRFADAAQFASALRAATPPTPVHFAKDAQQVSAFRDVDGGRPPTRSFGPRPPGAVAPLAPVRGGRRWWPLVAAALAAVAAAAVLTGAAVLPGAERPAPSAMPAAATRACPPAGAGPSADLDGDGCATPVVWRDNVLEVAGARYRLGRLGDQLLLGDWDCDGRDTPALYRPSTGQVFAFSDWAAEGAPLPPATTLRQAAGGTARLARSAGGCDRVEVR